MKNKEKSHSLGNVRIILREPEQITAKWVGRKGAFRQLIAAWSCLTPQDLPMNPCIIGKPGIGKTTLAATCAKEIFHQDVFIQQCSSQTSPEELIIYPALHKNGTTRFIASPLLSAALTGSACILESAARLNEKSWTVLSSLLDERRTLESQILGEKIVPHKDFRFVAITNEGEYAYELPEFINSRLTPKINVDPPNKEELKSILQHNVKNADESLIERLTEFLKRSPLATSIRDNINILRYCLKLNSLKNISAETAFQTSVELASTFSTLPVKGKLQESQT